jgi:8-amino-7-oxononanoate synthase
MGAGDMIVEGLRNIPKIKKLKERLAATFQVTNQVKSNNLYYWYRTVETAQGPEVVVNGRKMLMFGSYDYLGLANDPEVKEAASKAVLEYGTSTGGARLLAGTTKLITELEKGIAEFKETNASTTFNSGYLTNLSTISTLAGEGDLVLLDKYVHASIYDGAKFSEAKIERFEHNDMESLEKILETSGNFNNKLIVVDGVYSAAGDLAPLPDLVRLAKKYDSMLMVDEAHAIGVIGDHGKGLNSHFGVKTEDVDIWMSTFSKSFASTGGYIAGSDELITYLRQFARGILFSASPPAAIAGAALASLNVMKRDTSRLDKLWENIKQFKSGLENMGYDTMGTESAVVPVLTKDVDATLKMAKIVSDEGIFACPFIYPAVPLTESRFRTCVTATHTSEHINRALDVFEKAGKAAGVI